MLRLGFDVTTSDYVCEEVKDNIAYNCKLNSVSTPPHIPHNWGDPLPLVSMGDEMNLDGGSGGMGSPGLEAFPQSLSPPAAEASEGGDNASPMVSNEVVLTPFDVVVASDILLYVDAYPLLVRSLCALLGRRKDRIFVMAWRRRLPESRQFFDQMTAAGYSCTHEGRCVYTFVAADHS